MSRKDEKMVAGLVGVLGAIFGEDNVKVIRQEAQSVAAEAIGEAKSAAERFTDALDKAAEDARNRVTPVKQNMEEILEKILFDVDQTIASGDTSMFERQEGEPLLDFGDFLVQKMGMPQELADEMVTMAQAEGEATTVEEIMGESGEMPEYTDSDLAMFERLFGFKPSDIPGVQNDPNGGTFEEFGHLFEEREVVDVPEDDQPEPWPNAGWKRESTESGQTKPRRYPLTDIATDEEGNLYIQLAVAGFGKEDLRIDRISGELIITGTYPTEDAKVTYAQEMISKRNFERKIMLDSVYHGSRIIAQYDNGILTIMLEPQSAVPTGVEIH